MSPQFHIKRQPRTDLFVRMRLRQIVLDLERVANTYSQPDDDLTWEIVANSISGLSEVERYLVDPQLVWSLRETP